MWDKSSISLSANPSTGSQRRELLLQEVSTPPSRTKSRGRGQVTTSLPALGTLFLALRFWVYSFASSVVWGPTTFAICFLLNSLAKCLSVWSQRSSMWNSQDVARLNFQDSSTCSFPRKVLAACEVTYIHFQRAGVRWSTGRGVKIPDKLYLLWSQHTGCQLFLRTLCLPWVW